MDVSIILVNYNSLDYLRECLQSIYEWTTGISFEIVVVDNASPAGDVDSLKKDFAAITLIKSGTNLGFAGANNLGFQHSSGEYVLFLNPDTRLVSAAINQIMQRLRSLPDAGIAGCKLLNDNLSVQTTSILSFPTILNSFLQMEYFRLRWPSLWGIGPLFSSCTEPAQVEAISGACMMVKRDVFEQVGMFSTDYFMYSEDVDLCYKTAYAGLRNYYMGDATIVHYGGKSAPRESQTVMKTRAELRFCEKHYGRLYAFMFRIASAFNAILRLAVIKFLHFSRKGREERQRLDSAYLRWRSIAKTLMTRPVQLPRP